MFCSYSSGLGAAGNSRRCRGARRMGTATTAVPYAQISTQAELMTRWSKRIARMALAPCWRAWKAIRSTASRRPATRNCSPESERSPPSDRTPSVNLFWGRAVTPTTSPRIDRMWYPGRSFMVTTSTTITTRYLPRLISPGHFQHIECLVQLSTGHRARLDVPALDDDLADGAPLGERLLGHRGRLVVPEVAVERRDDRRRTLGVLPHPRLVRFDAGDAAVGEQPGHVRQQPDRLQQVARHHRQHHVELEVALRAGERHRRVVDRK